MSEKQALVPQLRFPEFRNLEGWKISRLGDGFERLTAKNAENNKNVLTISAQLGLVSQLEYFNKGVAAKDLTGYYILHKGDFAYNKSYSKGYPMGAIKPLRLYEKGVVSTLYICFRARKDFNDLFFEHYFELGLLNSEIAKIAQEGGRAHGLLNVGVNDFFEKTKICYPQQEEQQKIADCLSSLDELITAQAEKIDALKTHKKGLMQQLFPREGETIPRLRFPEFQDEKEWEQKLIEDFFFVGSSKRVLQQDWTKQGVPFYRTRELVSLSKNEPFSSEIFISEELFREISEKYGLPSEGDFLVSGVGTLGISYQVKSRDRFYFKDGNVLWFKFKSGIVSTFFKYCFEADEIQNQILAQASISTVGTYTIQNAKTTKFSCPTNTEEQQIIADCLSSLDALITAQAEKIDALKTHKKGLMQQLFPSGEVKCL